jgi:hypothetical protein
MVIMIREDRLDDIVSVSAEKDDIVVKIKNGRKALGEQMLEKYLDTGNKKYLDFARVLLSEHELVSTLRDGISKYYNISAYAKTITENFDVLEKFGIEDIIRDNFEHIVVNKKVNADKLVEISKRLKIEDKLKEGLRERLFHMLVFYAEDAIKDTLFFYTFDEFRSIVEKFINSVVDDFVRDFEQTYFIEGVRIGRGYYLEKFNNKIIFLAGIKSIMSRDKISILQNTLMRHLSLIEKMIKNRAKKEHHVNYLKAVVSLLPDSEQKKFIHYFL